MLLLTHVTCVVISMFFSAHDNCVVFSMLFLTHVNCVVILMLFAALVSQLCNKLNNGRFELLFVGLIICCMSHYVSAYRVFSCIASHI